MCYPKPGPRCAAHARQAVERAKASYLEQAAICREVEEAVHSDPADIAHYRDAVDTKLAAYEHSLREYETTPEGQDVLQASIEQLRASGDTDAANLAEARLEAAVTERARLVENYTVALEYAARLDSMSPAEKQAVMEAEENFDRAVFCAVTAESLAEGHSATAGRAIEKLKDAEDAASDRETTVMSAEGVYAESIESGDPEAIAASTAALTQARTDFAYANNRVAECHAAAQRAGQMHAEIGEQAQFERDVAARARLQRDQSVTAIAAGLGSSVRPLHLGQPHSADLVYRNPDQSINVARYEAPSDGFPHGRFHQATGVTVRDGVASINFADGSTAEAVTDYASSREAVEPDDLVIVEPHSNAQPALGSGESFHRQVNRAG